MHTHRFAHVFLFAALVAAVGSCTKHVPDSLSGREALSGHLLIDDPVYHLNRIPPGKKAEVYLYPNPATNDYLYKKLSDSAGNFMLDFINSGSTYRLSARIVTDSIEYVTDTIFSPSLTHSRSFDSLNYLQDSSAFIMHPDYQKCNYVSLRSVDAATGDPLTGTTVCLFTSLIQFRSGDCAQASYSIITSARGEAVLRKPLPGRYYVLAKKTIGTTTLVDSQLNYTINPSTYRQDTLRLH